MNRPLRWWLVCLLWSSVYIGVVLSLGMVATLLGFDQVSIAVGSVVGGWGWGWGLANFAERVATLMEET